MTINIAHNPRTNLRRKMRNRSTSAVGPLANRWPTLSGTSASAKGLPCRRKLPVHSWHSTCKSASAGCCKKRTVSFWMRNEIAAVDRLPIHPGEQAGSDRCSKFTHRSPPAINLQAFGCSRV
jgi:hypothetical protein